MNITYVSVTTMSRAFSRARNFIYLPQCPDWMAWCGGGPLDNGAAR